METDPIKEWEQKIEDLITVLDEYQARYPELDVNTDMHAQSLLRLIHKFQKEVRALKPSPERTDSEESGEEQSDSESPSQIVSEQ